MGYLVTDDEVSELRLKAFLDEIFLERGVAAAAGVAAARIEQTGSPEIWAKTFRKYHQGEVVPRSSSIWTMARSVRVGTRHTWCSGPIALECAGHYFDLICVLALWQRKTSVGLENLIESLERATALLPIDLVPELKDLFDLPESELRQSEYADYLNVFVKRGDIASVDSAYAEVVARRTARSEWILEPEAYAELDEAWSEVCRGSVDDLWRDDDLQVALAIAGQKQIGSISKRQKVLAILSVWAARKKAA
jgi:hypothetical protein